MSFLDWLGYKFQERMSGKWKSTREGASEQPYSFDLVAVAPSFGSLARDQLLYLDGTITLGGLAQGAKAKGTLRFTPWIRRRLEYDLDFVGDDGKPYHLTGVKTIRHLDAIRTWTKLPSRVLDASGATVGEGTAYFGARDFFPLWLSFRITRGISSPARLTSAPAALHAG